MTPLPRFSFEDGISSVSEFSNDFTHRSECAESLVAPSKRVSVNAEEEKNLAIPKVITKQRTWKESVLRLGWWWELASVSLSLSCMVLTANILFSMQNRPIEKWKLPIQPNSLIAVFSTISKSALLYPLAEAIGQLKWMHFEKPRALRRIHTFDGASRGPWGAFTFLWDAKGSAALTSLGATIVVLLLAFEPFTQQVLVFSTRRVEMKNMTGYVTATSSWLGESSDAQDMNLREKMSFPVTAAILRSASSQKITEPLKVYCSTMDCQYPDIETLAVCSSCTTENLGDVALDCKYYWSTSGEIDTDDLSNNTHSMQLDELAGILEMAESRSDHISIRATCTTGGRNDTNPLEIVFNGWWSLKSSEYNEPLEHIEPIAYDDTDDSDQIRFLTLGSPSDSPNLSWAQILLVYEDRRGNGYVWRNGEFFDGKRISFCQAHNVSDGFYRQRNTIIMPTCFTSTSDLREYIDPMKLGPPKGEVTSCQLKFCAKRYEGVSFSGNGAMINHVTQMVLLPADPWFIDYHNVDVVDHASNSELSSEMLWNRSLLNDLETTMSEALDSEQFFGYLHRSVSDESFSGNWSRLFERIAEEVSQVIKSPENPDSFNTTGKAYGQEVYVQVRWEWFILPLSLVVLSIIFIAMTIFESSKRPYLFKNSSLALLWHGVQGWDLSQHPGVDGSRRQDGCQLVEASKRMVVTLEENGEGSLKLKKD